MKALHLILNKQFTKCVFGGCPSSELLNKKRYSTIVSEPTSPDVFRTLPRATEMMHANERLFELIWALIDAVYIQTTKGEHRDEAIRALVRVPQAAITSDHS